MGPHYQSELEWLWPRADLVVVAKTKMSTTAGDRSPVIQFVDQ